MKLKRKGGSHNYGEFLIMEEMKVVCSRVVVH